MYVVEHEIKQTWPWLCSHIGRGQISGPYRWTSQRGSQSKRREGKRELTELAKTQWIKGGGVSLCPVSHSALLSFVAKKMNKKNKRGSLMLQPFPMVGSPAYMRSLTDKPAKPVSWNGEICSVLFFPNQTIFIVLFYYCLFFRKLAWRKSFANQEFPICHLIGLHALTSKSKGIGSISSNA